MELGLFGKKNTSPPIIIIFLFISCLNHIRCNARHRDWTSNGVVAVLECNRETDTSGSDYRSLGAVPQRENIAGSCERGLKDQDLPVSLGHPKGGDDELTIRSAIIIVSKGFN